MIDRTGRDAMATLLRQLASGHLPNLRFEEAAEALAIGSEDPALDAVRAAAWYLYSDLSEHRLRGRERLGRTSRRAVARWVCFLHSDVEYLERPAFASRWRLPVLVGALLAIGLWRGAATSALAFGLLLLGFWLLTGLRRAPTLAEVDADPWPFPNLRAVVTARRRRRYLAGGVTPPRS